MNGGKGSKLQFEWEILKKLEHLSITPKFRFFESIDIDGEIYEVLWVELLRGEWLQYHWAKYSQGEKWDIVAGIITGLKQFHALTQPYFYDVQVSIKGYRNYFELIKEKFEILSKKAEQNPFIKRGELSNIRILFDSFPKIFDSEKPVLVHHDIWYKYILSDTKGLSGIIDFDAAIFATKQLELFRLLHHKFSVRQYLDSGSQDYTEMEFLELLLSQIELQYPDLKNSFQKEQFLIYNLVYYISLLSKCENSWYNHKNVTFFKEVFRTCP